MTDVGLPWVYPYQSDPRGGEHALRPVALVLVEGDITRQYAMADTGSDHTILSPKVADDLGIDLDADSPTDLAFAGREQPVYPATVALSLLPPRGSPGEPLTWDADVVVASHWVAWFDVLLGQRGFLDRYTVTFSRHAAAFAVEPLDVFDQRFESPPVDLGEDPPPPRLQP